MTRPASSLHSRFLGTLSYSEGLLAQEQALGELLRCESVSSILLGLDHLPVATLGVRGEIETDLAVTPDELRLRGLELRKSVRGGQATIHSPGQLVIYPCVNLRAFNLGARSYVRLIERTTETWLRSFGIEPESHPREPGFFVKGAKLAAFGFKISRGLTSHGLAINVSNDLSLFDLIKTCGVTSQPMTRLADLGVSLTLEALFLSWTEAFRAETAKLKLLDVDGSAGSPLVS
jgi:lipoate-protein ligase B